MSDTSEEHLIFLMVRIFDLFADMVCLIFLNSWLIQRIRGGIKWGGGNKDMLDI